MMAAAVQQSTAECHEAVGRDDTSRTQRKSFDCNRGTHVVGGRVAGSKILVRLGSGVAGVAGARTRHRAHRNTHSCRLTAQ
jgi:hypothetical protein